ncbi:MAG: phosphoadenylyl-sulfate reductase [Myxococcales bacterium]
MANVETFSKQELDSIAGKLAASSGEEILHWANERFGERAAIASSFGAEDVVLIDLARKHAPKLRFFTLDTGRLHPETYEVMEAVRNRYGVTIESYFPDRAKTEELENTRGWFSFRESLDARKACCGIRKVEPLGRALAGKAAWVTGLRREQSPTRTGVDAIEIDAAHGGIAKLNPLASWNEKQVWAYIKEHGVPYNELHDRGFPSFGCAPCTRAIKPYEDVRAGRWWWETPENKECGLHGRK